MEKSLVLRNLLELGDRPEQLPWQPFRDGVEIYRLYSDGDGGASAALLRYQPGASVPHHSHPGFEHIFVLSGSQSDCNGTYEAGTLAINPPQSSHSVASASGCIVLVIWEKPAELWS
ncbi:cupin domain-containing protein [Altericista sp. CCNU0014]|uniref:cupin domain-containing protein n=1 Tax=Altericista sp. CCNU0014 TaxID=3082949 RepID=UPI00384A5282